MTVSLVFEHPSAWVPIDLEHPDGAALAARGVLARYDAAVPAGLATDLEQRFAALADLSRRAQVQAVFALVPDSPLIGLAGSLFVRMLPAGGGDPIADVIAQTVPASAVLLDGPEITQEDTALGRATVALHRWSLPASDRARPFGRGKAAEPVVDHVRWSWLLDDEPDGQVLVTIVSSTDQLRFSPELRELVAAFARGIRHDTAG